MKTRIFKASILLFLAISIVQIIQTGYSYHPEFSGSNYSAAYAYPPAVGIIGKAKNCVSCHSDKGPWKDDDNTIIDILDKKTKKSLKQPDGSFLISVKRNEIVSILTVIGRAAGDKEISPYRNAFIYVDPTQLGTNSLSKYAPGWNVNLPMSCKIVGDKLKGYEGAKITKVPSTIRPTDAARDSELILQVMLTKADTKKGKAKAGTSNYFERKVMLKVID